MGDNRWLKNSFVYLIILVAALALYLASDEAGFTTGQVHVIDGGWTAG